MGFALLQTLIIGTLVTVSLYRVLRQYFPKWTARHLGQLADHLLRQPHSSLAIWLGTRLHRQLSQSGGCGSDSDCGSCKGCTTAAASPPASPRPAGLIASDAGAVASPAQR